ncbi:MAG: pantoate--beta-alanine ligase [Chloroflexi bacterium]|nr:pantoate--beta-alanine ligase [Chloroflexota bacterium]
MQIARTIDDMKAARRRMRGRVGLVPTMGYLHEGHLVLARNSNRDNKFTVASIFVNPTQFGPKEDFAKYPRDPDRDCALLEREKVDVVFMPPGEEMYPPGFNTWVDVAGVTERLEGAIRPGHFRGVATVCNKLFNIVDPHRAYFGQKDAQQVVVIKKMAKDLNMNLEIVVVPTVRENDGLAMSSRNVYLSPDQRKAAAVLHQSLSLAREMWRNGERRAERMRQAMTGLIRKEPLAGPIDYLSIADAETLEELEEVERPAVVSLAVRFGPTRLIDNITLP